MEEVAVFCIKRCPSVELDVYLPGGKTENMNAVVSERSTCMTLGPLEYLVVGFEGNRFNGQILSELRTAREKGIIRVVDLVFLTKDDQGNFAAMELSDLKREEAEQFAPLAGELLGLLSHEDIEQVAAGIPKNSSVGLLLFEHTWAIGLKEAIKNAGGVPVAGGLVAPEVLQDLEAELMQQNAEVKTT
jgi:hypothetical protein